MERIPGRIIEYSEEVSLPKILKKEDYGTALYLRMVDELSRGTGHVILIDPDSAGVVARLKRDGPPEDADPIFVNDPPIASARISITLDELSFATGSRGTRLLWGFKRGMENPYNAGLDAAAANEFSIREHTASPSWFEAEFADDGGLRSGLELGRDIELEAGVAGLNLAHAEHRATMGARIEFRARSGARNGTVTTRSVLVSASGFAFDLAGHLMHAGGDYRGGIRLARKSALKRALKRLVRAVKNVIAEETLKTPLLTRLTWAGEQTAYVAAGENFGVGKGVRFYNLTQLEAGKRPTLFTVTRAYSRVASVAADGPFAVGDVLASLEQGEAPGTTAALMCKSRIDGMQCINPTIQHLHMSHASPEQHADDQSAPPEQAGLLNFPYRAWRWTRYDRPFRNHRAGNADPAAVTVAVIDSGVDYNHRDLRENIFWDEAIGAPGFDFISGDPRAYDDYAHGTEVAGAVVGAAKNAAGAVLRARILPLKVFTPFGITNSGAIYNAFDYAARAGAKIIVAAWAAPVRSQALLDGIKLAEAHGCLVVASAGDRAVDLDREPQYPASFSREVSNLVVVAGSDSTGAPLARANHGSGVSVYAPGAEIRVARPRGAHATNSHSGLAAGSVAGTLALGWSRCPSLSALETLGALVKSSNNRGVTGREFFASLFLDEINRICK